MLDNIPSREEVEEAINEASELRDKIIDYRNSAQKYDDDFVEQHDEDAQEIHLDILPYGEELIRTSELPDALRKVIDNLNRMLINETSNTEQVYASALGCIEEARNTLENCSDIPRVDEDDEN